MKILFKILLGLLLLLALIVGVALIVAYNSPKNYEVKREMVINQPRIVVYDYIKYLKNQNEYSKWANMDPKMKKEFRGEDATIGFVSAWESLDDNVGKGEQEITKMIPYERVDYKIRFLKPMEAEADSYMSTAVEGENATKVTWGFKSEMKYPFNIMLKLMDMEKMIGDDLQTGLNNLKSKLEQ